MKTLYFVHSGVSTETKVVGPTGIISAVLDVEIVSSIGFFDSLALFRVVLNLLRPLIVSLIVSTYLNTIQGQPLGIDTK